MEAVPVGQYRPAPEEDYINALKEFFDDNGLMPTECASLLHGQGAPYALHERRGR